MILQSASTLQVNWRPTTTSKEAADYETGPENTIGPEDAAEAIRVAERFVAAVRSALADTPDSGKG